MDSLIESLLSASIRPADVRPPPTADRRLLGTNGSPRAAALALSRPPSRAERRAGSHARRMAMAAAPLVARVRCGGGARALAAELHVVRRSAAHPPQVCLRSSSPARSRPLPRARPRPPLCVCATWTRARFTTDYNCWRHWHCRRTVPWVCVCVCVCVLGCVCVGGGGKPYLCGTYIDVHTRTRSGWEPNRRRHCKRAESLGQSTAAAARPCGMRRTS